MRLPRSGVAALLIAAGLLLSVWWHKQPLARIPLRDGGELRLVEVHYGSSRDFHPANERRDRMERLIFRPKPSVAVGFDCGVVDGDVPEPPGKPPELFLGFEESGAADGQRSPSRFTKLEVLEDGAPLATAENCGAMKRSRPRRTFFSLSSFPRRDATLHLRLTRDGEVIETTIHNPHALKDAPVWKPEPLPQSRRVGKQTFTLTKVEVVKTGPGNADEIEAAATMAEEGRPPARVYFDYKVSDATGNTRANALPRSESAWRIRSTFYRPPTHAFLPEEVWSLGRTTLPGPGEYRVLEPPSGAIAAGLQQAILFGPGEFFARGERIIAAHPPSAPKAPARPFPPGADRGHGRGSTSLMLRIGAPFPAGTRVNRAYWIARARSRSVLQPLRNYDDDKEQLGPFHEWQLYWENDPVPPDGAEVEIELIPQQPVNVDFYVRPPARES